MNTPWCRSVYLEEFWFPVDVCGDLGGAGSRGQHVGGQHDAVRPFLELLLHLVVPHLRVDSGVVIVSRGIVDIIIVCYSV